MVFRRDITYGLVALLSALFASALLSDPTWAQSNEGCPGPVQVARFEGKENRNTDDFNITGDTFRVRYTITELDRDPVLFDRFLIRPRENDLGVGQSILVFEPGSGSENILEGPGTFDLQIESDGFQYTVFVDDCRANNNGNNNTDKKKKNKNNKRNNNGNNNGNNNSQFDEDIDEDGDVDQDDELFDAENDLNGEETNGEDTFGDDFDDDLDDDGPAVSADAGDGVAEASTPNAVARAGDPDELEPITSTPDDVVNEIPTSGPLPNTGGMPLSYWLLPLAGLLLLAGLPVYRWVKRWG